MHSGPFDLVIAPGAWCKTELWSGVEEALKGHSSDLRSFSVASWPQVDGGQGLTAHAAALKQAIPNGSAPVVLAAHSFGSFPMLEVAAVLEDRLAGLIFIDAFLPQFGRSAFEQSEGQRGPDEMLASASKGWVRPPSPKIWGLSDDQADQCGKFLQPQGLKSFEDCLSDQALTTLSSVGFKAFLGASKHPRSPFRRAFDSLEGQADWISVEVEGGHMLPFERPAAVAYWCAQFLRLAAGKGY